MSGTRQQQQQKMALPPSPSVQVFDEEFEEDILIKEIIQEIELEERQEEEANLKRYCYLNLLIDRNLFLTIAYQI